MQATDAALEALFETARAQPPAVPDGLMARVLSDAEMAQPAQAAAPWAAWLSALGGLPGLGGLVTATCVGFWLGVAPPALLPDMASVLLGGVEAEAGDLISPSISGFGWDMDEG